MSKAYPTWGEQSIGGKALTLGWLAAFVVGVLALAALVVVFVGAFVWFFAVALVGEWKLWALVGALAVVALVWASIRD